MKTTVNLKTNDFIKLNTLMRPVSLWYSAMFHVKSNKATNSKSIGLPKKRIKRQMAKKSRTINRSK